MMLVKRILIAIISKSVHGGGCQSGLHLWWGRWSSRSRSRRIERRRVGGFWEERFCNDRMNYCIALMIIMIISMITRLLIMMVFMIRIRWGNPRNQIGYIFKEMLGGWVEWARSIQISRTNLAKYWQQNQPRCKNREKEFHMMTNFWYILLMTNCNICVLNWMMKTCKRWW